VPFSDLQTGNLAQAAGSEVVPLTHRMIHVALIAATPWLQLALNPSLFITPGGNRYIDPWLYTGLFLSLPDFLVRFPDTYYAARLSWLLPGYAAHRLFSPLVANYVLHLGFFYALLAATYSLAAVTNRRTAMFVTAAMAWNPVILAALSWDYVDGAGIVFITATLLSLEKSARSGRRWWLWSLLAGAFMASLPCSNLFLVVTWPVFGLFLFLRRGPAGIRGVVRIAAVAVTGAALALLGFASVNVALGGHWLFLAPQLRIGKALASVPNPWQLSGYAWVRQAPWLVLPAVATASAAVNCVRWSRLGPGFARTMQVVVLAMVAVWTAVQLSGTPVFQISFYSSYLAPFALIALAAQWNGAAPAPGTRGSLLFEVAAFAVFTAGCWLIWSDVATFWNHVEVGLVTRLPAIAALISGYSVAAVSGLIAGVVTICIVQTTGSPWAKWGALVAAFLFLSGAVPPDLPNKLDRTATAYYETVVNAHRFIDGYVRGRKLRIWSSDPRGNARPIIGTASTYFWDYSLINYELPKLDPEAATRLTRDTRLILLVPTIADAERSRAPLRQFGYELEIVASKSFGAGDLAMAVIVADLR
jgi:hypothetical protein